MDMPIVYHENWAEGGTGGASVEAEAEDQQRAAQGAYRIVTLR